VFLLIGLHVNIPQIAANIGPIAVAVLAVLVSRALVVYGLGTLGRIRRPGIPVAYQHVLFWGGLRGAISLALAWSLPAIIPESGQLQVMAFGVILFTLLGQGTTIHLLLHRLGLVKREEAKLEYERRHARLMAARAAHDRLQQLQRDGMVSAATFESLSPQIEVQIQMEVEAQRELLRQQPALQAEEQEDARREVLRAQRATLATMLNDGLISQPVYEELVTEVDAELEAPPSEPTEEP
jgi:monovalent cation:H+ antiporter, CPA1 family